MASPGLVFRIGLEMAPVTEAVWGVLGSKSVHGSLCCRLHVDAFLFQSVLYIYRVYVSGMLSLEY